MDRNLELAAASLGANPVRTFWRVTFPIILPGVLAGALFAFITSWDEVVVSIFMTSTRFRTLPVEMWEQVRQVVDPTVAAVATVVMVVTTTAAAVRVRGAPPGAGPLMEAPTAAVETDVGPPRPATAPPALVAPRPAQALRRRRRPSTAIDLEVAARRVRHAARAIGLGQDHDPADDRRLPDARTRARSRSAGRRCAAVPPYRRDVGMVFQNYALFPHMTAAQNVAFPLQMRGVAAIRAARAGRRGPRDGQARVATATAIRASCRAASSSASRSPGRSCSGRGCC